MLGRLDTLFVTARRVCVFIERSAPPDSTSGQYTSTIWDGIHVASGRSTVAVYNEQASLAVLAGSTPCGSRATGGGT